MSDIELEEFDDDETEGDSEETEEVESELRYIPGATYTNWQLEELADQFLKEDTRRELCRKCGEYGEESGHIESSPQFHDDGKPIIDEIGDQLYVDFPELICENSHRWYKGEGKRRGNQGKNHILFESHLKNRRKREIYTSLGYPEPEIVSGLYNRSHPQGRPVNTEKARKEHGAAFYK